MRDFLVEYWKFVREHKSYWMIPILLVLALTAGLVIFTQGSAVAPFIYTLF